MVYTRSVDSASPLALALMHACALAIEASRLLEASSALLQTITSIANNNKKLTVELVNFVTPLLLRIESPQEKGKNFADLSNTYRNAANQSQTIACAISRSTLHIKTVVGEFSFLIKPEYEKTKNCTLAIISDAISSILAEVTFLHAATGDPELALIRDSINGLHAQGASNLVVGKLTIEASETLLVRALRVQRVLESRV